VACPRGGEVRGYIPPIGFFLLTSTY